MRLFGSPFRALTTVALMAFLIANAEMSVTGLLTGDADRRANGGFGAVVFALLLMAMVRRFRRTEPSGAVEWERAQRFFVSPVRLITLASLGFFVVTSTGLFVVGVATRDPGDIVNGSIGAVLIAFLIVQTSHALESLDEANAAERSRLDAVTPRRRPLYAYPLVVVRRTNTLGRLYVMALIALFLITSVFGTWSLLTTRDPRLLIFPPATVLFILLFIATVGSFVAADDRASSDETG
jgi:hypothetical protein